MPNHAVDILENSLAPDTLAQLLRDHTTGRNILWATHDYESLGEGYQYVDEIRPELITGEHGNIIKPRVLKTKEEQTDRAKDMAEVFTPAWVCNAQNNLVDEAWFGRKDVFNIEDTTKHTWQSTTNKIEFPANKTWKDYQFVPLQDFTRPWTDADLYAKYGLTDEEIQFIESMIKPME